jgi:hypothetical protein
VTGAPQVRLRSVGSADVAALSRANTDETACGRFMWWGFRSDHRLQARLDAGELITESHGMLAVESGEGELLGDVSWNVVDNTMPPHGRCWNLGISALERAGFTREGVLRRAAFRDGAYRDMVLYSILRDEV